jgi:hypothetical protein
MSAPTETLIVFRGRVQCRRAEAPLGLTLVGRDAAAAQETAHVAFASTVPPPELPPTLEEVAVQRVDARAYRIGAAGREFLIADSALFVHRDVSQAFYAAVPPRRPPWHKRLFWLVVLTLAARPLGRRWLTRRLKSQ